MSTCPISLSLQRTQLLSGQLIKPVFEVDFNLKILRWLHMVSELQSEAYCCPFKKKKEYLFLNNKYCIFCIPSGDSKTPLEESIRRAGRKPRQHQCSDLHSQTLWKVRIILAQIVVSFSDDFTSSNCIAFCVRLILPYERHIKGEEDKPLPPSKPRKPYKRSMDGKVDAKKKRSQLDRDMESEVTILLLNAHSLVLVRE